MAELVAIEISPLDSVPARQIQTKNEGPWAVAGRVELLRKLFDEGLSCAQIAAVIGVSRNGVVGKLHRLGWSRQAGGRVAVPRPPRNRDARANRAVASRRYKQRQKQEAKTMLSNRGAAGFEIIEVVDPTPIDNTRAIDLQIPMAQRKQLIELTSRHCHWPIGDPQDGNFFFCGGPAVSGHSYCMGHCRTAYAPRRR